MTNPITVTDEMRQAVWAEACQTEGHRISTANVIKPDANDRYVVTNDADGRLPYLECDRCGLVWIVLPQAGQGYADTEAKLRPRLVPDDPINKRPTPPDKPPKAK